MSETYSDVSDANIDLEDILNSSDDDDDDMIRKGSLIPGAQVGQSLDLLEKSLKPTPPSTTIPATSTSSTVAAAANISASNPNTSPTPSTKATISSAIPSSKSNPAKPSSSTPQNQVHIPDRISQREVTEYTEILRRRRQQREEEEEMRAAERDRRTNKLNAVNPLDLIEQDESAILGNEEKKFENFEKELILDRTRIPADFNVTYTPLDMISQHLFTSAASDKDQYLPKNNYGLPKAMCVLPKKLIIVGTSYGMVVQFDIRTHKITQVIGNYDDYRTYGSVSSLDVSDEGDTLLVGYEKGTLSVFETYSGSLIKQIQGVHVGSVLAAKLWKGRERIISSDSTGNLFLFKLQKVFWSISFDKQLLMKAPPQNPHEHICYIEILGGGIQNTADLRFLNNSTVVALASASSVIVITLEPAVKSLYKIERPSILKSPAVPCVSWGRGVTPNSTMDLRNYPILAVAWGPLIQLYQLNKFALQQIKSTENVIGVGFDIVAHVLLDHSIFYLQWVSDSMLYLLDSRNQFKLIYTGETRRGEYSDLAYNSTDIIDQLPTQAAATTTTTTNIGGIQQNLNCVKHTHTLTSELNYHFIVKDSQGKPKRTFNNSIVFNRNEAYFCTTDSIVKVYFFRWDEAIQRYMKSKDWCVALKIAEQIRFGKLQAFASLPSRLDPSAVRELSEFCVNLLMSYLEKEESRISMITEKETQYEAVWKLCKITMEYLIEIEEFEVLFRKTKIFFMRMDYGHIFLALLEPFIMKGRLKRIPNDYFNEILQYFVDRKKFNVVQLMIVNLDLSSINVGETIIKCLEHQLFTPLIYINTRKDNDFVAPLYKMYQEYQSLLSNPKPNVTPQKYVYRCLWFLRMTLQQKMYPNEPIDDVKFPQVIRSVSTWYFSDEIIVTYAKLDSAVYFDILYMFFVGKPADILREKNDLFLRYFKDDSPSLSSPDLLDHFVHYAEFVHEVILKKVEKLLRSSMNSNVKLKRDFCSFIGRLSHLPKISIDLTICQTCVEFLLMDRFTVTSEKDILRKSSDLLQLIRRLRKQEAVLNLLTDRVMSPAHDDEDDDDDETAEKSEHKQMMESIQEMLDNETLAFLSYLTGNMKQAFDFYFIIMQRSWIKGNRYKIFYWLNEAFSNPDVAEDKKNMLIECVIENAPMLVLVSARYTKNIVNTYMKSHETSVFSKLMEKPALLLDYLENLLENRAKNLKDQQKDTNITNGTLALYITLLCQMEPARVVHELKVNFYPLDEIIEFCRLNHAHDAVAYICERQGNFEEAISIYSSLFIDECWRTFARITKGKHHPSEALNPQSQKVLHVKFQQLIDACIAYAKTRENNSDVWLNMAHAILTSKRTINTNPLSGVANSNNNVQSQDIITNINSSVSIANQMQQQYAGKNFWKVISEHIEMRAQYFETLNEVFSDIIARLFIEISNWLSVSLIVELISKYKDQFSFRSIQQSFEQILSSLSQEISFLHEGKEVIMQDFLMQNRSLLKKITQGNSFSVFCSHASCGLHLHNYGSNIVTFPCSHAYHRRCLDVHATPEQKKKKLEKPELANELTCPECMKEEIPYIQQIELELHSVSQKLSQDKDSSKVIAAQPKQPTTPSNSLLNSQQDSSAAAARSSAQESQKDSKSIAQDDKESKIKQYNHDQEMFRKKQLKRLQRFDAFLQKDADTFEEIRQKYQQLIYEH